MIRCPWCTAVLSVHDLGGGICHRCGQLVSEHSRTPNQAKDVVPC